MNPYLGDPDFTLYVGDSREVLREREPASVDCCVTSPPYWGLRDYGTGQWDGGNHDCEHAPVSGIQGQSEASLRADRTFTGSRPQGQTCSRCGARRVDQQIGLEATPEEFVAEMVAVFREVRRVLAPHVTDRPTKAHEYVFLLSKQPRYFFDQEAVREPAQIRDYATWDERKENGEPTRRGFNAAMRPGNGAGLMPAPAGRNVRSVWEIPTQPYPDAHFATFPEALPERCIKAGCPPGGTVLDPFMGSGTVALVARRLERKSIGIELNEEYAELAARRLQQLSLFAHVSLSGGLG